MAWLRIDDGFAEHYKISELTDKEFRIWMRTLCYAARNNGRQGRLTPAMRREIVGFTPTFAKKLVALGLLDQDADDVLAIHDWRTYNPKDPTAADRMKRHRDRNDNRNPDRNETRNEDRNCSEPSRAGTRARTRPVPSNTPSFPSQERKEGDADADIDFTKPILKDILW
jgi:hypothetical protein